MVKTNKLDAEKNIEKALSEIFKNVAEYKNIDFPQIDSLDDIPQEVIDALRDLAGKAVYDISQSNYEGENLKLIDELTKNYPLAIIENLIADCMEYGLEHKYYAYLAGIGIMKKYIL